MGEGGRDIAPVKEKNHIQEETLANIADKNKSKGTNNQHLQILHHTIESASRAF